MITIDLTDSEAELFIILRRVGFFELVDEDVIIHKKAGVVTDVKKYCKKEKELYDCLWQRKKGLDIITG